MDCTMMDRHEIESYLSQRSGLDVGSKQLARLFDEFISGYEKIAPEIEQCQICTSPEIAHWEEIIFAPDRSHLAGGIPGLETRLEFYICDECKQKPDWEKSIESLIVQYAQNMIKAAMTQIGGYPLCTLCDSPADMMHFNFIFHMIYGTCEKCRTERKEIKDDLDANFRS